MRYFQSIGAKSLRVAVIYALVGALWILFSDQAVSSYSHSSSDLQLYQTWKGWFYVLLTAALVYFLVRAQLLKIHRAHQELQQSEKELKAKQVLLTSLIESQQKIVIFALDNHFNYLLFNLNHRNGVQQLYGVEIVPGMNILDVIPDPVFRERISKSMQRALAGESFSEIREQPATGNYHEFLWNPIVTPAGEIIGLTAFIFDITKEKQLENELLQHRDRLEVLVNERAHELKQKNEELIRKNEELERFNELFVGRELRINELKKELQSLKEKQ